MVTRGVSILIFLGALLAVIDGFEPRGKFSEGGAPTAEDCMRPPMKRIGRECCSAPKEKIWGDLKGSLRLCFQKFKDSKQEPELMRQESEGGESGMMTPAASDVSVPTEDPADSPVTPSSSPRSTPDGPPPHPRRPHWKRPHHFRRQPKDSCFMECVFEDQGFLVNKMLNKEALLTRLSDTLGENAPWHKAAVAAFETCYAGLQVSANSTCQSGSEEIFRCTFKQLFFNCPDWVQSDYCTSLKEFYQKCPNGPPPETNDSHTTAASEEDAESSATTERYTQGQ